MSLLPSHKSKFNKRFEELFGVSLDRLDIGIIDTAADSAPAALLPHLLKSFNVEYSGSEEKVARELIKNALKIKKGTVESIKEALKAVIETALIKEWFEYGDEPYFFKVKASSENISFDENTINMLEKLANEYKNTRSVLRAIELEIRNKNSSFNACANLSGESIEILPYQTTFLAQQTRSSKSASGIFICEITKTNIDFKGVY
ncbi:phage tail protein I [Campylobacter lanienae]|uniref:phage tail protein I n=1 Tax=Campylobacter lanienae TaxID=75658 RepID=UPI000BB415BA|nr:phage tail protein I [Campylobacter lanienae]